MKHWTDQDIATLRNLYPSTKTETIAAALGRPVGPVYQKAAALGLKKTAEYLASDEACRLRRGAHVGAATQFRAGHETWNKGMKGLDIGGKETRFKPGNRPHTWNPIGHERLSKEGYLQRKMTDTGCTKRDYVAVHHLVWQEAGREIPRGHALVFRDGNKRNFALENLELVTRAELMRRNSYHNNYPKEVAQAIQLRGALNRKINRLSKEAEQ